MMKPKGYQNFCVNGRLSNQINPITVTKLKSKLLKLITMMYDQRNNNVYSRQHFTINKYDFKNILCTVCLDRKTLVLNVITRFVIKRTTTFAASSSRRQNTISYVLIHESGSLHNLSKRVYNTKTSYELWMSVVYMSILGYEIKLISLIQCTYRWFEAQLKDSTSQVTVFLVFTFYYNLM